MRAYELIWDTDTAERMQQLVEAAGGAPGWGDLGCPLLPNDYAARLEAAREPA